MVMEDKKQAISYSNAFLFNLFEIVERTFQC